MHGEHGMHVDEFACVHESPPHLSAKAVGVASPSHVHPHPPSHSHLLSAVEAVEADALYDDDDLGRSRDDLGGDLEQTPDGMPHTPPSRAAALSSRIILPDGRAVPVSTQRPPSAPPPPLSALSPSRPPARSAPILSPRSAPPLRPSAGPLPARRLPSARAVR